MTNDFTNEMARWAEEHGSERLRLGLEDGYRMIGVYLAERLAVEAPGFFAWLPDGSVRWHDRSGPTESALMLRRAVQSRLCDAGSEAQAQIVWVKDAPDGMWGEEDWGNETFEGVVVPGWLNRYTLIGAVTTDEVPVPWPLRTEYVLDPAAYDLSVEKA